MSDPIVYENGKIVLDPSVMDVGKTYEIVLSGTQLFAIKKDDDDVVFYVALDDGGLFNYKGEYYIKNNYEND